MASETHYCERCKQQVSADEWVSDPIGPREALRHIGSARWAKNEQICGYRFYVI